MTAIEVQPANLAVLASAFSNQATRNVTFNRVTNLGSSSNTSAAITLPTKVNPNKLPDFPSNDYLEGSSMAVNYRDNGLSDCNISSSVDNTAFAQACMYNDVNRWQHGYRTPMSTANIPSLQPQEYTDDQDDMDIDTDDYYKTMSSALYGNHALDNEVLEANMLQRRNLGAITRARNSGLDRLNNPSIFGSPATALPMSVSAGIPISNEKLRINDTLVGPVMTSKNLMT